MMLHHHDHCFPAQALLCDQVPPCAVGRCSAPGLGLDAGFRLVANTTAMLACAPPSIRCRPAPSEEAAPEDWFNIMVLHQNRVERGAQAKNSVQEAHIPVFMDLVVWGHEHECKPEPSVGGLGCRVGGLEEEGTKPLRRGL